MSGIPAPAIELDLEDDIQFITDCEELGNFPFDAEEAKAFRKDGIQISREYVDDFLTNVCGIIDVDPAEAIAQKFPDYTTMCQWLVSKYNGEVFAKFERQYQRIGGDLSRRVIDYWVREMPAYGREMKRTVPNHFKNFLYSLATTNCWWYSDVGTFLEADDAGDCTCLETVTQECFYEAYLQDEFGVGRQEDDEVEDNETENEVEDDADDAEWA